MVLLIIEEPLGQVGVVIPGEAVVRGVDQLLGLGPEEARRDREEGSNKYHHACM